MTNYINDYWNNRYLGGGNSGPGSSGRLLQHKQEMINRIILGFGINTVFDYGCGDGRLSDLIMVDSYTGYDPSVKVIMGNRIRNKTIREFTYTLPKIDQRFDMCLSIDVIFHLMNEGVFQEYMNKLFAYSSKYVLIYSSNGDSPISLEKTKHMRDWRFTDYVEHNLQDWRVKLQVINPYPYDPKNPKNTSISNWYLYEKKVLI